MSPCPIKEIIFFCKHWTGICKQLFTFRKSAFLKIGLCPKVIIWMAFYGAVAGCTLEKKYEHDNTRTMNLIRNFLQFLLFYKSHFYQRENTNSEAYQLESVVGKANLKLVEINFQCLKLVTSMLETKCVGDNFNMWATFLPQHLKVGLQHSKDVTNIAVTLKDIFIEVG